MTSEFDGIKTDQRQPGVIVPRLLIGLIVLICAEVFSGASLQIGLWNPWTWLVTYWLYFAHFFFFTTLAIRTHRTSFWSLYLWGVLYGLYESWITKVIWFGYGGDGRFAMGRIGPYGFSELSMVFTFHPVMSFLIPLAVACLLCPPLRQLFPDLAWFTGRTRGARLVQAYLVFSLAPIVGLNGANPTNLARNLVVLLPLLFILSRLARTNLAVSDGRSIVKFGRWGFVGLCLYLAFLYGVFYFKLRPEGLPSARIQGVTLAFYVPVILSLKLYRPREPLAVGVVNVEPRELRLAMAVFVSVISLGFVLTLVKRDSLFFVPIVLNTVIWTLLGFLMTAFALWQGVDEFRNPRAGSQLRDHEVPGTSNANMFLDQNALDDPNPCAP